MGLNIFLDNISFHYNYVLLDSTHDIHTISHYINEKQLWISVFKCYIYIVFWDYDDMVLPLWMAKLKLDNESITSKPCEVVETRSKMLSHFNIFTAMSIRKKVSNIIVL